MQPVLACPVLCVECGSGKKLRLSHRRRLSFPLRTLLGNRYIERGSEPQESRSPQGSKDSTTLSAPFLIELTESLIQAGVQP